ncbi:MAG: tetratricopeptide repeat protein, partial [Alphaproteobacteria bacterium]|nr:tetratricopeptide repeat protein [Alphaproteobacteria bacterium]
MSEWAMSADPAEAWTFGRGSGNFPSMARRGVRVEGVGGCADGDARLRAGRASTGVSGRHAIFQKRGIEVQDETGLASLGVHRPGAADRRRRRDAGTGRRLRVAGGAGDAAFRARLGARRATLGLVAACGSPEEQATRHFERALAHVEAGDDAKAMVELRNVLRIEPKNAEALYQVGLIHQRAERYPQAFQALQGAAAERPGYVDANMRLGELALLANEVEIAAEAAAEILEAHPDDRDGRTLEAAVMLRRGELERAEDTVEAVLAEAPTHANAAAVKVGVLQARGRTAEARAEIAAAVERIPENVDLRMLQIALFEQAGDADAAREAYAELVELEPEVARHRVALAGFFERQGDALAARTVLREALDELEEAEGLGERLVALVYRE